MEVIMVYPLDPSKLEGGGGIRYVHNLITNYLDRGIKVKLLGINLVEEQTFKHPLFELIVVQEPHKLKIPKFLPQIFKDIIQISHFLFRLTIESLQINTSGNSVIHAHRSYLLLPFILFCPKTPKVCTLHMKPLEYVKVEHYRYFKFLDKPFKIIDSFCLERVDMVIAVNNEIKQSYLMRFSKIENKIQVISGSGVSLNKFKPLDKNVVRHKYGFKNDENIIIFVGRLEKIKNVGFLIRSFSLLNNNLINSKLIIVGRGSKLVDLIELVDKLHLNENVLFMGEMHPESVPEIYNCADICVLASYSESGPTVLREALSCGVPMVSTRVGNVSDIITNKLLGAIIDSYDEKMFAKAMIDTIKEVKSNPEVSRSVCRDIALKKFAFEDISDRIVKIYENIIKN